MKVLQVYQKETLISTFPVNIRASHLILKKNYVLLSENFSSYLLFNTACAAASLAIGTRKGEQDT